MVPVPFDHGIGDFRTLDDLHIPIWMDSMRFVSTAGTSDTTWHHSTELVEGLNGDWFHLALFGPPVREDSTRLPLTAFDGSVLPGLGWHATLLVVKLSEGDRELLDIVEDDMGIIENFVHR